MAALELLKVSNKINTAFVERQNETDRGRNGRKTRKTYCFLEDWDSPPPASKATGWSGITAG